MATRPLAEEFGEPRLVFDFLMQDGKREVVSAMVLAESHVADLGIAAHRAPFSLDKNLEHVLDVGWIGGHESRWACRYIVKVDHAFRQLAAEFINSRHQCLKVIAVFDARLRRSP